MGDTLARTETTIQIILPFLWLSKIPLVDDTGPTMSISWANYLNPPRHVDFLVTDRSDLLFQQILNLSAVIFWARPYITDVSLKTRPAKKRLKISTYFANGSSTGRERGRQSLKTTSAER